MRDVVVLGSTGSIGVQALSVIAAAPDRFRVVGLASGGNDLAALADQVLDTGCRQVAVPGPAAGHGWEQVLAARARVRGRPVPPVSLLTGMDGVCELAAARCDVVLNAISGSVGLRPTLAALGAGRLVALANKESLVAGGPLVQRAAAPGQLIPVDSEHSALAQCLRAGGRSEVRRLVLTASGGPFRGRSAASLASAGPADALAHPTWQMGPLVTVNSATLMNKGLETIEAHLLFEVPYPDIEVVVHPQSIVHSMVEFTDGAMIAQLSPPDMRLPIALALGWPDRVAGAAPRMDLSLAWRCEFEPLDERTFPAVGLAREAGIRGGTAPCVLNAANEVCVAAFLAGRLSFPGIVGTVTSVLTEHEPVECPGLDEVFLVEEWARRRAAELVEEQA